MQAQETDHHRFVNPDNEWSVVQTHMTSPNYSTNRFRFSSDSVLIGDYYYHSMEINPEETGDNWQVLYRYFRESSGKVFTLESGDEILAYDFTLNVPDTFNLEMLGGPEFYLLTTEKTEVTLMDQIVRKKLTMSCSSDLEFWHHNWVQGIGDIDNGPFGGASSCFTDVNTTLLCFHYQGNLVYTSDSGSCFRTSTKDFIKDHDVKIYPNPASHMIFIQTELRFTELTVLNSLGKVMLSSEQFGDGLDVSNLPQGLYYIKLTSPENKFATLTFSKF